VQKCRVQIGWLFELVKLIFFFKTYLGGGLTPFSQTVGSLLIPPGACTIKKFTAVIYIFS
jgi:hypothetical protein